MSVLEVRNLKKSFGKDTVVLKGVDFSLEKGETVAIIGSSGSGKTTLLRCLNFLTVPDEGQIVVNGETLFDDADPNTQKEREIRRKRLHFGLVFQNFNLFPVHFKSSLIGHISGRLHHFAACGNVSSDINLAGSCVCYFSGIGHQAGVDLFYLILKMMHGEIYAITTKGRSIDNIASRFYIAPLKGLEYILMGQYPLLCADTLWHAGSHQIRTCSSIKKNNILCKCLKILFCHVLYPPYGSQSRLAKK